MGRKRNLTTTAPSNFVFKGYVKMRTEKAALVVRDHGWGVQTEHWIADAVMTETGDGHIIVPRWLARKNRLHGAER